MSKYRIGDTVLLYSDHYLHDHTTDPIGTIYQIGVSGWSDCGGIYSLRMKDGRRYHCSEEAIKEIIINGREM